MEIVLAWTFYIFFILVVVIGFGLILRAILTEKP